MSTDYVTEDNLTSDEYFAYKRSGLTASALGTLNEGVVVKIIAGQSSSVQSLDLHIGSYELSRRPNLLVDGDMEAVGVSAWAAADTVLTKETTDPVKGSRFMRVTAIPSGVTEFPRAQQIVLVSGKQYRFTGFIRSDGTLIPRVNAGVNVFVGTTSTEWQYFDVTAVATATTVAYVATAAAPVGTEYIDVDEMYVSLVA
jgi:hypothetical protein